MTIKPAHILTINSGSSSIKFSLYQIGKTEDLTLRGEIKRIGLSPSHFHVEDAAGKTLIDQKSDLADQEVSLKLLFGWLEQRTLMRGLGAVGHRVVHGGTK